MTGWNLPPRVNESDIPGNRPEDVENEKIVESIIEKFTPIMPEYSPFFRNILQIILDCEDQWVSQKYIEFCITSDSLFMGREYGDIGFNRIIGPKSELINNLKVIANHAKLNGQEREYLLAIPNIKGW